METEKGKGSRVAARRRGREVKESGPKWALLVAGAFLLALVAFATGVRMGKALGDLENVKESPSPAAVSKKETPFRMAVKGGDIQPKPEDRPAKEAVEKASSVDEPAPSTEVKKLPPPDKPKFTLQIAALNNPEEARDMLNQLRAKGYPAYLATGSAAAKGALHRVRVGQFSSLAEARQFALAFEKKEKKKTIITNWQ